MYIIELKVTRGGRDTTHVLEFKDYVSAKHAGAALRSVIGFKAITSYKRSD